MKEVCSGSRLEPSDLPKKKAPRRVKGALQGSGHRGRNGPVLPMYSGEPALSAGGSLRRLWTKLWRYQMYPRGSNIAVKLSSWKEMSKYEDKPYSICDFHIRSIYRPIEVDFCRVNLPHLQGQIGREGQEHSPLKDWARPFLWYGCGVFSSGETVCFEWARCVAVRRTEPNTASALTKNSALLSGGG